jgi:hypothetical protein
MACQGITVTTVMLRQHVDMLHPVEKEKSGFLPGTKGRVRNLLWSCYCDRNKLPCQLCFHHPFPAAGCLACAGRMRKARPSHPRTARNRWHRSCYGSPGSSAQRQQSSTPTSTACVWSRRQRGRRHPPRPRHRAAAATRCCTKS